MSETKAIELANLYGCTPSKELFKPKDAEIISIDYGDMEYRVLAQNKDLDKSTE